MKSSTINFMGASILSGLMGAGLATYFNGVSPFSDLSINDNEKTCQLVVGQAQGKKAAPYKADIDAGQITTTISHGETLELVNLRIRLSNFDDINDEAGNIYDAVVERIKQEITKTQDPAYRHNALTIVPLAAMLHQSMNGVDLKRASEDLKNILELANTYEGKETPGFDPNQFYVRSYASNYEDIAIAYQEDLLQYVEQDSSQLSVVASTLVQYDSTKDRVVEMVNGYRLSDSPEVVQEALEVMSAIEYHYPGTFEGSESILASYHNNSNTLISNVARKASYYLSKKNNADNVITLDCD